MNLLEYTENDKKIEIENLRAEINRHNGLYYQNDAPEIADAEFDALLAELKRLEEENPALITPDSPTQRVGGKAESFTPFVHRVPMMSLDNSYNLEDLRAFDERCQKLADGREFDYVAELKIDGLSVALHYENGVLAAGATRGDGAVGDDVLSNVKMIRSIPLKLKDASAEQIEVRGEIFMARSVFGQINTGLAGIWFSVAYLKTRNLWFVFGLHLMWNWVQGAFLGLPVSGITELTTAPLVRITEFGAPNITGGIYGIEGGIACTVAIFFSTVLIWYLPLLRPTAEMLALTSEEKPKGEVVLT